MKKLFASVLASVLVSIALIGAVPATSFAAPSSQPRNGETTISGYVSSNGKKVNEAYVTATCNGHTKHFHTTPGGFYTIQFTAKRCSPGSLVTVTASKNGQSGANQGYVNNEQHAHINVSLNNVSVPEYGTLVAISTVVVAGGILYVLRRRVLSSKS